METKKQIRQEILMLRDRMKQEDRMDNSYVIMEKLLAMKAFQDANQILIFANYGSEVDTQGIMEYAFMLGKKVYCPLVEGKKMNFYRIFHYTDLHEGYKGIPEPAKEELNLWKNEPNDLMIMPGVAFDEDGNRIGYGGGFYDKFIADGFDGIKAAVCFSIQMVEEGRIPAEENDVKPDFIITEHEVLRMI